MYSITWVRRGALALAALAVPAAVLLPAAAQAAEAPFTPQPYTGCCANVLAQVGHEEHLLHLAHLAHLASG